MIDMVITLPNYTGLAGVSDAAGKEVGSRRQGGQKQQARRKEAAGKEVGSSRQGGRKQQARR